MRCKRCGAEIIRIHIYGRPGGLLGLSYYLLACTG